MVAFFTPLNLLILMVAQNCLTITDCADSGRKRDKNVYTAPSKSSAKKSRNVREAASTSRAAAEAGSSSRQKFEWTKELDKDILALYYSGLHGATLDWNSIYTFLKARHPSIPPSGTAYSRIYKLMRKLTQSTPAHGEGNDLWTTPMKADVIRIYFQTTGGNEMEHALNMYNRWRSVRSYYPDISPMDLLYQAENMLIRHDLLKLPSSLPKERIQKIFADRRFKFDAEQEDIFRRMCDELHPNEPMRMNSFYDELCKRDPRFSLVSPQKLFKKAWYLVKDKSQHQKSRTLDVAEEATDFLSQSGHEEHHQFHEFMGVQDNSLVHSQSAHHHAQEIGSSSLHQGSTHDHPDLDLRLDSGTVDTSRIHDPNVDLDLSLSLRKKKGKSIWKQGSS